MRSLAGLLDEYGESHRHPANERIHLVCVPAILWSLVGMFALAPLGTPWRWMNLGLVVALGPPALALRGPRRLAVVALAASLALFAAAEALREATGSAPLVYLGVFVAAWIGQFVGHAIEGARPAFTRDLLFLLVGPLWLLVRLRPALAPELGDEVACE